MSDPILDDESATRRQSALCRLSAAVSLVHAPQTKLLLGLAFDMQISALRIKEVILQSYLFCGFPAAIEGLIVFNEILKDRSLTDANYDELRDAGEVRQDGEVLCKQIYGKNFEKLMSNMNSLSVEIQRWMLTEGYGKVLSRPILSPVERELCVVSSLTALQRERQLVSHVKGALNVGASEHQVHTAITCLEGLVDPPVLDWAFAMFNRSIGII